MTVGEIATRQAAHCPANADDKKRRETRPKDRVGDEARPGYSGIAAEVIIDSPAGDEEIQRLKDAVEAYCPVLDIIGNATPVAVTVRKQDLAPAAMHAL